MSFRSTRPPTYTSYATAAPTYRANEQAVTSAQDNSESVRTWSASLPSPSSVATPDSDTEFDHTESSLTDTVSVGESSAEIARPAGPRFIYYRVYAKDGAIPSVNPAYSDDPYLGRILAKMVSPPHTVASLKYCLIGIENIDDTILTSLFISTSSQTPMDDARRLSIFAYPGPGSTPSEPMALVAMRSGTCISPLDPNKLAVDPFPPPEPQTPFETRYVYYQAYSQHGAVRSKQPADSNDPYVGGICVDCVPPPHTAASIMRCISKIEELDNSEQSQLFTSISSTSPIGEGHVSILTSDCPGSTPEDPMAFVELPTPADVPMPYPTFPRKMKLKYNIDWGDYDPNWLNARAGEIVRITNDELQNQSFVNNHGRTYAHPAYEAVNYAGKMGFIRTDYVKPCRQ